MIKKKWGQFFKSPKDRTSICYFSGRTQCILYFEIETGFEAQIFIPTSFPAIFFPKLPTRQRGRRSGGFHLCPRAASRPPWKLFLFRSRGPKTNVQNKSPFPIPAFDSRVSSLPFGVLAPGWKCTPTKPRQQKISACSETVAAQNRSGLNRGKLYVADANSRFFRYRKKPSRVVQDASRL